MFRALAISGAFRPCFLKDACSLRFCLRGSFLSALVNSTRLGNPDSGSLSFPSIFQFDFGEAEKSGGRRLGNVSCPVDRLSKELLAIRGEEVEGGIAHAQHHLPRWGRPAVEQRGSCVDMGEPQIGRCIIVAGKTDGSGSLGASRPPELIRTAGNLHDLTNEKSSGDRSGGL